MENKPLSVDNVTGAFTRLVALPEGWEAGSVTVPTTQGLYVLDGHLTVDGHDLPAESYLWLDEQTGAASFLVRADEWTEPRQEHHDCVETCYTISGGMKLGERGTMTAGDYFWRPHWIRHGPMEPLDDGFYAFLRVDRPLVNHYTSTEGVPLTY